MLSYRHAFHAGNHADVLKHAALALIFQALQRKDAGFCFIDTHAGAGGYDLRSTEATKNSEYRGGIARIWSRADAPMGLQPYLSVLRELNSPKFSDIRFYPGSPVVAQHLLRHQDRMVLIERHPTDHAALAKNLGHAPHCRIEQGDGFQLLKAFVPPHERRGVVLLDPAYELKSDYRAVLNTVIDATARWATGTYLIWYPLIARSEPAQLVRRTQASGLKRVLNIELIVAKASPAAGLWGSGLLIVNPPYQLDTQLKSVLAWLHAVLAEPHVERGEVRWLIPE